MALNVGAVVAQFKSDISGMQQGIASVKKEVGSLKTSFANVGGEMATAGAALVRYGAIGATAMGVLGVTALKTAGNLEQQRMAFKTLLGSVEDADKAIEMIKKDAATTPFELTGLIEANKLLTAVTHDAPRSESMLLNVGKALSAVGKGQNELDRIIVNLQQIGAVGKASMIDIKQFAFAGIPIFEMLTETTGKQGEALDDLISSGGVTFGLLEKMFAKYGNEGGKFANAFADQAGTMNQSWSNLIDTLVTSGAEFVQQIGLFDAAKKAITGVTSWIANNKDAIIAWVREASAQISTFVGKVATFMAPVIEWLKQFFSEVENRKAFIFAVLVGLGVLIAAAAIAFIAAHIVFIAVVAGIMLVAGFLYKYWDEIWAGIKSVTETVVNAIKTKWDEWMAKFRAVMDVFAWIWNNLVFPILYFVAALFARIFYEIAKVAETVWAAIGHYITDPINWAVDTISALISGAVGWIKEQWDGLKNWFVSMKDAIGNAIVAPFQWAKEQIEKIAQKIKDAADKINPFHRESPSLVDNVQSGVSKIVEEYKGMVDSLSGLNLRDSIMQFSPNVAGAGAGGSGATVNQTIYAQLQDGLDAQTLAERLAFKYRSQF